MRKNIVLVSALLTAVLFAGNAFAQSTGTSTLSVSSTPVTSSVSPGTSVPLGTITLSSPGGSYTVNSIPSNLNISGGGLANNLSNCALYTTSGASTTAALGPTSSIVSGGNSFSLSPALTVTTGNPVTLQIRCDVSSSAPSGSIFQFMTTSTSTVGTVGSSVSGASLAAETDFVKQVPAGLNNAIIGIITLDTTNSNQPITLSSVPLSVSASGGGANLNALSSCVLTTSSGTVLTTGGNAVSAITGSNTFTFDTPFTVQPGGGALLVLRCNVSPTAPVGSTLTVGFSPTAFQATANGSAVTVTQGLLSNGQPGNNSGLITIAAPGTAPASTGVGTPSTPGIPNTGEGGSAPMTLTILLASLAVAVVAARLALKTR
jgi:hypothetical protein